MEFRVKEYEVGYYDGENMLAQVTFPECEKGIVEMNHTFVDESLRGQGIASKLLEVASAHIRAESLKVRPTCTYAVNWYAKHKEYDDIVEKSM